MRFTEERFEAFLPRKDWKRGVDKVQKKVSWHDPEYVETEARHREELGDFSTTLRVLPISALAVGIGVLCAYVALALLRLIGLFTNLFYYGHWGGALVSPAGNHLGWYAVLVPVGGGLIVGLMARYGSERIRGHGIPEAIEAILINGSRVEPKVAFLKPVASAIAIGSGGPFGAEGPIIMTGGAFGSMIAQLFHLTNAERKTLLVAGAAGGMSATFAAPVASVLLAVELLLFEWKPRSLVPVALASVVADVMRRYILGFGPMFPVPRHPLHIGPLSLLGCALAGLEAMFLPHEGAGFWPLVSMGATLGGTMRAPFTSIIFAFELTQDSSILLPLLIASVVSHTFTVLTLKRSILTEKVARRGYHLSSEYAVDPLEILFARDVMRTKVAVLPASSSLSEFQKALTDHRQSQRLLPVVDGDGVLVGVVTRGDIYKLFDQGDESLLRRPLRDAVHRKTVEAYPDEPLRSVVYRMAEKRITRMPVVDADTRKFLGLIALDDLLKDRARQLEEEKRREQVLSLRVFLPGGGGQEETETQDQAETRAASLNCRNSVFSSQT